MSSSWSSLSPPLSAPTASAISKMGFASMTPVQSACIPLLLGGRKDVSAEAVTGSGKTLAFVVPVVEMIIAKMKSGDPVGKRDVVALIVSPTRELAAQIADVVDSFLEELNSGIEGDGKRISKLLAVGGTDVASDLRKFDTNGGHIIVGTPGRIDDLLSGKGANAMLGGSKIKAGLKACEILVLDEADRLLGLGFASTVNSIMSALPKQRRTGLFSATQTKDVQKLTRAGLRNPVLVSVKEKESVAENELNSTPSTLENRFVICEAKDKFATLVAFLRNRFADKEEKKKIMVFFSTCACVEYFGIVLGRLLKGLVDVTAIHGKKAKRDKVFDSFRKKSESGLLICTDVMARGIDIADISWVVQFDPPSNAEAFVHRCGRTARIGNHGSALLFLLPTEDAYVNFIELNQKVALKAMELEQVVGGDTQERLPDLLPQLRDWQRNDRSVMDKATRAFVSFVQAYSKHECKFILRLKDLPFGDLATAFGLLVMPRMPELKKWKITGFEKDTKKKANDIKYKDKQKERSRQAKLKVYQETGSWPGFKKAPDSGNKWKGTDAWSKKVDAKGRKESRKELKALRKRKREEENQQDDGEGDEDDKDLEDDYRLLKKMRKGKVATEEFDKKIDLDDVVDDSDS